MPLKERIKISKNPKKNPLLKTAALYIIYTASGFILATGTVLGDMKPFGISVIAVSKKKYFLFSACGAIAGYLMFGIDASAARYLAAAVIACAGAFAAGAFGLDFRGAFSAFTAFTADFATGVVLNIRLGESVEAYFSLFGEAVLCAAGAYFFFRAIGANYRRLRFKAMPISDITCIIISITFLLINFSSLHLGVLYPFESAAVLAVLICVKYAGNVTGVLLSLCFGFAFSVKSPECLFIVGAFSFSSMFATLFSSLSNFGISASFLCSAAFFSIAAGSDEAIAFFVSSLIGTVLFMLIPPFVGEKIEQFWDTGRDSAPDGTLRQNLVLKLRFASSAMAAISDSVDQVREKINDITRCENEKSKDSVSEEEYIRREIILEKTNQIRMVASDQFYSIAGMLEDLAFEFDDAETFNCALSSKIRRLLGEYEIYPANISVIEDKYKRIRVEILTDSGITGLDNPALSGEIGRICSRYFQNGKITNFKNGSMLSFFERPNYSLSVGFAQHSAEGKLCGDTVKIINDNKGHTILIISDGMGKGSRAALDGAMGAGLISKLLNAGFGFDSALKVVNSALFVKSNDESLATLDIANIDLFTGKCEIFKAGAPSSYIIKNSSVTKCELSSMPAGILRGIEFAKRTVVLSPDDAVVLMSDGITDLGDEWLNAVLPMTLGQDVQKSADFILSSALEKSRGTVIDDMSIIFAKLGRI